MWENQHRHTVKSSSWEITAPNINLPSLFLMSYICQSLLSNWERQHLLTLACSCINMNLSGFTISVFLNLYIFLKKPLIYVCVWANSLTLVVECSLSSVAMGTVFSMHVFLCRTVHLGPVNLLIILFSHICPNIFQQINGHWWGRSQRWRWQQMWHLRHKKLIEVRSSVFISECPAFRYSSYSPI